MSSGQTQHRHPETGWPRRNAPQQGRDIIEGVHANQAGGRTRKMLALVRAKRRDGLYEPGRRSGAWVKMRINKGQELVIGGYVPTVKNFDSIIVGYYEHDDLIYVARVRNGFIPALRAKVFERFHKLGIKTCPFSNLPQRDKGRWGQGLRPTRWANAAG